MTPFFRFLHAPQDDMLPPAPPRRRTRTQHLHVAHTEEPAAPVLDEYGIPENPFSQPAARPVRAPEPEPRPVPPSAPPVQPRPQHTQSGPQFSAPVAPEVPDWLRTAQQMNPSTRPRPQGPRVQAAPRPPMQEEAPAAYRRPATRMPQAAPGGYAPMQRRTVQSPAQNYAPAQTYAPVQQQPTYQQQPAYPQPAEQPVYRRPAPPAQQDWQVEAADEREPIQLPDWVVKVPWVGIAATVCIFIALFLWIRGIQYEKQTEEVYAQRAAQEQALVEKYPLRYRDIIAERADRYNLSPAFVAAIVMNESSFRPEVSASSGVEGDYARGLMQLRPTTAEWIHGKTDLTTTFSADDLFTPEANLEYGCWYLNYLSEMFYGDPVLVAAAYHAGQGEVRNWLNTEAYSPDGRTVAIDKIPFGDTRRYVTRVLDAYAAYLRIYYGG